MKQFKRSNSEVALLSGFDGMNKTKSYEFTQLNFQNKSSAEKASMLFNSLTGGDSAEQKMAYFQSLNTSKRADDNSK